MSSLPYKAVVLDMDGVLTPTTSLHEKAWKRLFDEFLEKKRGKDFAPFTEEDYTHYLNGKTRYDAIRSFLHSRQISIPEGSAQDQPGQETVYGLGKRKNEYFHQLLKEEGIAPYADVSPMISQWRQQGLPLAVVSSSRNARMVLDAAGILDCFDVRVDGQIAEERGLKGKPDPAYFLAAMKELAIEPADAVVFEDAIAGVKAAKSAGFGWVVGVARKGEDQQLKEAGADFIVHKLTELDNHMHNQATAREARELPHALEQKQEIAQKLKGHKPVLFLDYDGTLCHIVKDPDKALMTDEMRNTIERLANKVTVAVVSGRDRADVQQKVNLKQVVYAGSHGFDIEGPNGLSLQYEGGRQAQPALDEATSNLESKIGKIEGVQIERKKYAIAVHYRNVADERVDEVTQAVKDELSRHDKLKGGGGKKIMELKPAIDWHKGRATRWLLEKLNLNNDKVVPIFIGDDLTDEDGLKAIHEDGIGILAGEHGEKTWAHYRVENVEEVQEFLQQLDRMLAE